MRLGLVAHPRPGCQVLIVSVEERNALINLLPGISIDLICDGVSTLWGVVSHVCYLGASSRHEKRLSMVGSSSTDLIG